MYDSFIYKKNYTNPIESVYQDYLTEGLEARDPKILAVRSCGTCNGIDGISQA